MYENIINYLQNKYGEDIVAIYGIGSFFLDTEKTKSDADVIVILKDTSKCPRKDYTTALFEERKEGDISFTFLYGTLEDYMDRNAFLKVSFADWSWAVRSLKFGSKFIFGNDIRKKLPTPEYDYGSIFLRSAYHLNKGYTKYSDAIAFTKAVFKFGFFLAIAYYPDENVFDRNGILRILKKCVEEGNISEKVIEYYEKAIKIRNGEDIGNITLLRREFVITFISETIRVTDYSLDEIISMLENGFGNSGFHRLIALIDTLRKEKKI